VRYALVLMDDTRDYLSRTRDHILAALPEPPEIVIEHIDHHRRGYTAQMVDLWQQLADLDQPLVLLWEADFLPAGDVPLEAMAAILDADHDLAQIALVRQPWWPNEHAAGGLLRSLEARGIALFQADSHVEHTGGWTSNPCLFRRTIATAQPWPAAAWSESAYGAQLRAAGYRFAYYGHRDDSPRVLHIGERTEASHGY
jgi:hypothetical protein